MSMNDWMKEEISKMSAQGIVGSVDVIVWVYMCKWLSYTR